MTRTDELDLQRLSAALKGGALAIRRGQRLQPAGGPGDKVFPPTYEGGQYALEDRIVGGTRVPCVLLDSVQSQANRMEQALKAALYRGKSDESEIPVVTVDFSGSLPEIGEITSLDAPHRLADAILRDSLLGTQAFRATAEGRTLDTASVANATGLYQLCPTALLFGLWDSTGPRGGSGTKFQRAIVSEIVGVEVGTGVKPSSRIDPLGIELNAGKIYEAEDGWTLDESRARRDKDKPVLFGKDGKPSEINHGNVTPSLKSDKGVPHHGGITMSYARQSVVLSLPALRRLRFPDGTGAVDPERNALAQVALAALGLAAAHLTIADGCDLRSRCLLVPDPSEPAEWEILDRDGVPHPFRLSDPVALMIEAADAAAAGGLPPWRGRPLVLEPKPDLVQLVRRSRELKATEPS